MVGGLWLRFLVGFGLLAGFFWLRGGGVALLILGDVLWGSLKGVEEFFEGLA